VDTVIQHIFYTPPLLILPSGDNEEIFIKKRDGNNSVVDILQ
jgi:hypothetical protein